MTGREGGVLDQAALVLRTGGEGVAGTVKSQADLSVASGSTRSFDTPAAR
jgi:hypothetical protein